MNTQRRYAVALSVLMVAATLFAITIMGTGGAESSKRPGPALHTPSGSATCNDGVKYAGTSYPPGSTVTVTIDGVTYVSKSFSGDTSGTVPNPDKTVAHNWSVTFVGSDGSGSQTFSGKIQACQPSATTTTAAATTTTVAATTTTAPTTTTTPSPTTTAPTVTTVPAPTTTAPTPTESSTPASSTPAPVPTPTTAPPAAPPSSGPLIPETE